MVETIQWTDDGVVMIDQRVLPREETFITCRTYEEVADAIRNLVIRITPGSDPQEILVNARIHTRKPLPVVVDHGAVVSHGVDIGGFCAGNGS